MLYNLTCKKYVASKKWMKNYEKKLVAVTLPLIAGVALSGTGFGLWVFNETVDPFTVGPLCS